MRQGDEGLEGVGTSTARVLAQTERGFEVTGEEIEVSGAAEWVCDGVGASGEVSVLRLPDGRLVAVRREAVLRLAAEPN
jgi:hypothetical protein